MNHIQKVTLIFIALLLPLMAEEVMKITLAGDVSDEKLSTISKIVFTENAMVAGARYNLDEIIKIEFYDEVEVAIAESSNPHSSISSLSQGQIGFSVTATHLSLTLPKPFNLSVSLYSINGRKIAELFSGNAKAGVVNLSLVQNGLATGIYSTVVKADNIVFVRKLIIK